MMSMMGAFEGDRLQGLHRRGSGHYGYLQLVGKVGDGMAWAMNWKPVDMKRIEEVLTCECQSVVQSFSVSCWRSPQPS